MSPNTPSTLKAARLVASVVVVLALSAVAFARARQTQQPPLTRDNLVTLLQTRALTNDELVQIIRRRGVDFTLTEENETALTRAGASMDLLYVISQNYRARGAAGGDVLSRPSSGPVRQPGSAADYFTLGQQHLNANRLQEALEAFQQVIRLAPDSPAGHLGAGLAYGRMGQNDEAVAAFQRALQLKPDIPELYVYLGLAQLGLHRDEEALATFRQALRYNPNNPLAQLGVGQAYMDMERFDEAIAALQQAARLKPDFAEAFSALSAAYGDAGRYEEGLAPGRRAVELKPDLQGAYINLSYLYSHLGRYQEELDAALQAVRLNSPQDVDAASLAYGNLSAAYGNFGRYQEALDAAMQAARLNPKDPVVASEAHGNISYSYVRLSQLPEALDAARQAVRAKPDSPDALAQLGYVQNELGQYQDALASAQRGLGLKVKPKQAGALYYVLGYALAKLNQRPRALEAFRQSIANYNQVAHPDADDTFYMGNSYMQLGDDQPAAEAFQRAIRMRPNFSLPRYSLGLLYYAMGNQRGAMDQYQILKTLDPRRAAKLLGVISK